MLKQVWRIPWASLAFLSAFVIFQEYKMRLGNAQASLAFLSAFVIFQEYKMRLGNAQASLAFLSAFVIFQEYKGRLGNAQASLAFLSAFVIFAANIRLIIENGLRFIRFSDAVRRVGPIPLRHENHERRPTKTSRE
jgi:uncharacterized membrane protein